MAKLKDELLTHKLAMSMSDARRLYFQNALYVNDKPALSPEQELVSGDKIRVGKTREAVVQ